MFRIDDHQQTEAMAMSVVGINSLRCSEQEGFTIYTVNRVDYLYYRIVLLMWITYVSGGKREPKYSA